MSSEMTPVADILAAYQRRIRAGEPVLSVPPPQPAPSPTAADLSVPVAAENPMRVLSRMQCAECGYDWTQPAAGGLCARCHSTDTRCVSRRVCVNRRV